jgi:hypothetical protein
MHVPDTSSIEYWQSAIQLFQPALIRLLDQLRGQLAEGGWQSRYETHEIWPDPPLPVDEEDEPTPQILYLLHLSQPAQPPKGDAVTFRVNLWELCYQICFQDYQPQVERDYIADFQPGQVQPDINLLDATGGVDWHALDHKAHAVVAQLLQTLYPQATNA